MRSLWLAIALTVSLLAIKKLTELLTVHNQECWRKHAFCTCTGALTMAGAKRDRFTVTLSAIKNVGAIIKRCI